MRTSFTLRPIRWRRLALEPTTQAPILMAVAYFLGAEAAFSVGTLSDKIFAPFWPPNVILFFALLLTPERRWWVFIAASLPAHVLAEIGIGMPVAQLAVAFLTNCMVALTNAIAVRHFLRGPPWLADLRNASLYILITAGVSPAIAALGGAFVPILGGGGIDNYWVFSANWYLSNALTSLTVGPVLVTWLGETSRPAVVMSLRRALEAAVLGVALVIVCTFAFEISAGTIARGFLPAALYSPLPLILWSAVRFGSRGASGAILVVTVVLIWRALQGPSLFVDAEPETNVLALQLFLTGLSIPVLLLGAAIDELRHAERMTRELAGSVLKAQDEERRRIARELHDSLGQNLVASSIMIARLRKMVPGSAAATVDQIDDTIRQSVDEVRTVSYLLHPPLLDDAGLESALAHYLKGFSQRSALAVTLDISPDIGRLSPETELALFRVVQEALTNVSRHSGSATARIALRRRPIRGRPSLVLTIEDAGKGFATLARFPGLAMQRPAALNGVGLESMRERLHQLGGRLEINSEVGRTIVAAIVPAGAHDR